jgi:hypothetical protein
MKKFRVPEPDLQITFFHRLQEIRNTYLLNALLSTVASLEINKIDHELAGLVSRKGLQRVAGWGLRGELVFAVPYVLKKNPHLLGYYRLLLGFSQKQFYGDRYGITSFKSMEEKGRLSSENESFLKELCHVLCGSAEHLIKGIGRLTPEGVHEMTLLTLGPQLRGGALNVLGSKATKKVFDLISSLLSSVETKETEKSIEVRNAAGRIVRVEFANDPDICIREKLPSGRYRNLVAIEIKGGRDYSNVHNRIGEAEKSHQKARKEGYIECWTIIGVADLDLPQARKESPSTDKFYHIDKIADALSDEGEDFRENLLARIGINA